MNYFDWSLIGIFLVGLTVIGFLFSNKNKNIEDYFLGGRSMPTWMIVLAATGTSISAGTFVGSPQKANDTNLTYLMLCVGAIIGGLLVAVLILPTLYKSNTITIYGYLGNRFGNVAKTSTSVMFLLGQLLTSGARLFIAAIAVSVILYGTIEFNFLMYSIIILGIISTIYTMAGGIKGLIYIDTIQMILIIIIGIIALLLVLFAIPDSFGEIIHKLTNAVSTKGEPVNKLLVIDTSFDLTKPYNLIGTLIGCVVFKFAQFSTDHDFVQRQLACKSIKKAGFSLVLSQVLSLPVVLIFLGIGLLLYVAYPVIMPTEIVESIANDSRDLFPQYICSNNVPSGLKGLMIIGLLAAALSSFNSAINAMSSSMVSDIYLPLKAKMGKKIKTDDQQIKDSKITVLIMGILLTGFAVVAAIMQEAGGQNLVDFATGVMSFSYAGMLGVFLCAVFTKRGNVKSVIGGLLSGCIIVFLLQPNIMGAWTNTIFGSSFEIAWPWWTLIGGTVSFVVCCLGKSKKK